MTSIYQPLDQGIIAAFKAAYKAKMLQKLVNCIDNYDGLAAMADRAQSCCKGLRFGQKANLYDAAQLVREAWDELQAESIAACWSHSRCLPIIQHCDVTASRNGYRKQVESAAIADIAKLFERIDLASCVSRTALHQLGLDEMTSAMGSGEKQQIIERWLSLENDPEVIAFEDIDSPELADQRESSATSVSIEPMEPASFDSFPVDPHERPPVLLSADEVSSDLKLQSDAENAIWNLLSKMGTKDKHELNSAYMKMNESFFKYLSSID